VPLQIRPRPRSPLFPYTTLFRSLVANARQLRLIAQSDSKNDRADAETLARVGRLDPALLKPIRHRGAEAQLDLALIRARDALVRSEEHTSELQSRFDLVCRLLLE